jgi:hypothetical protein
VVNGRFSLGIFLELWVQLEEVFNCVVMTINIILNYLMIYSHISGSNTTPISIIFFPKVLDPMVRSEEFLTIMKRFNSHEGFLWRHGDPGYFHQ